MNKILKDTTKLEGKDDLTSFFTQKEIDETAEELAKIETNLDEYKKNNNWEDLKKELEKSTK